MSDPASQNQVSQESLLPAPVVHNIVELEDVGLSPEALLEGSDNYTADNIKVLKGMEGVRLRPGMYLQGGTGIDGFHQLLSEIVDNAIDECQAGFADTVTVTIHKDEAITITDNGRGIPVDVMASEGGRPAVEVVFTDRDQVSPRRRRRTGWSAVVMKRLLKATAINFSSERSGNTGSGNSPAAS